MNEWSRHTYLLYYQKWINEGKEQHVNCILNPTSGKPVAQRSQSGISLIVNYGPINYRHSIIHPQQLLCTKQKDGWFLGFSNQDKLSPKQNQTIVTSKKCCLPTLVKNLGRQSRLCQIRKLCFIMNTKCSKVFHPTQNLVGEAKRNQGLLQAKQLIYMLRAVLSHKCCPFQETITSTQMQEQGFRPAIISSQQLEICCFYHPIPNAQNQFGCK